MAESQAEFSGETPRAETQGVDSTPGERGIWPLALEMQCVSPPLPRAGPAPLASPSGKMAARGALLFYTPIVPVP